MRAELYDAGTTLNIVPWMDTPGMQESYFRELDMEYQWPGQIQGEINERLRTTPLRADLLPWPVPFPGRCWIDWTERYAGSEGGLTINTARWSMMFDDYSLVPGSLAQIEKDSDYDPNVNIDDERMADAKTEDEIQSENPHPTEWLRLPLYNEQGGKDYGYCQLEQPTTMVQNYHVGDEFRPIVNYSPLFAPYDGRHPEWYDVLRADGTPISEDKLRRMSMRPDGHHRLYLRPANWRFVATVIAHYYYVSWWEAFTTLQWFTHAYFNRPPIYPRRHDLIHTTQYTVIEYMGTEYSYDAGISEGFNLSRGASFLRHQIIDAQWWTQSEAFIFTYVDPLTLAMWMWPPEAGDIVMGIGTVDGVTGEEEVFWMRQNRDLTTEYPRTVTGAYLVPDFRVTV